MPLANQPVHTPSLSVATFNELRAIQTGTLVDGDIAFVTADNSAWRLSKSSTTVVTSLEASGIGYSSESNAAVGAGRWFRLGINGFAGNTVVARATGTDAAFFPAAAPATKLSCVITTSSTRLWVEFTASGTGGAATTAASMTLYVNTVALTAATFGTGGCGTTTTILNNATFSLVYKRLLTGLTQGVNTIEAYGGAAGGNAACSPAVSALNHATLRVTEV